MENIQAPWVGNPPEEPDPIDYCGCCGAALYVGDYAYDFDECWVCEDCIDEYVREHGKTL